MDRPWVGTNVDFTFGQWKSVARTSNKLKRVEETCVIYCTDLSRTKEILVRGSVSFTYRTNAEEEQQELDDGLAATIRASSFCCKPPLPTGVVAANGSPPLLDGYHDLCNWDERDKQCETLRQMTPSCRHRLHTGRALADLI